MEVRVENTAYRDGAGREIRGQIQLPSHRKKQKRLKMCNTKFFENE